MCGANRSLIKFHDKSSVRMKTMFGRLTAAAPADVGDVAGDFDPPLHDGAANAKAATTATRRRRRLVLVVGNARGTYRWSDGCVHPTSSTTSRL
jgi:hypothetical protein